MNSREMVYQVRQMTENLDSKNRVEVRTPQIVNYLNQAQIDAIIEKYGPLNKYQTGFEGNQKRTQELQGLLVPEASFKRSGTRTDTALFDLASKISNIMYLARVFFLGNGGGCNDVRFKGIFVQTDDKQNDVWGPFLSPSLAWREVPYRIAQNKIEADFSSDFTLETAVIDYLRYPVKIDVAGYKHQDGSSSVDRDCELPEFLHQEIVRKAATLILAPIPDPRAQMVAQISQQSE